MTLSELEFIQLLPHWMRDDRANIGLAKATDKEIGAMAKAALMLSIWDKIDELPDVYLDLLAWQLDIVWYNSTADRAARIQIIRDSDKMHMILGSKAAVEQILSTYFGPVEMREWYEYGGTHDHFMLKIPNASTVENEEEFMRILNAIKRASSVFDGYIVGFDTDLTIYSGAAIADYSVEEYGKFKERYDEGFITNEGEQFITSDGDMFIAADE